MQAPKSILVLVTLVVASSALQLAQAGQGCPFDDGSCQEYCSQQGCNMGYCGHFAWIQCICRKCGDEWSWYDKVRYNPDKTVNQTELDSLKLNGTAPLILTNSSERQVKQAKPQQPQPTKAATLTTLLIPDLSDSKLDLNDIPDENSEKFLDYLAKNHEKLVQATSQQSSARAAGSGDQEEPEEEASSTPAGEDRDDDETVEIQISSSNNGQVEPAPSPASSEGPTTRLLRMALGSGQLE